MDAQFWIYVAIGAIYFLSRLLKKPEQAQGESPDPRPERKVQGRVPPAENTSGRPLTFEELLREITEGKPAPGREPQPAPRETARTSVDDEARSLEDVSFDETEAAGRWKPYEVIPENTPEGISLEESMHLEDTVVEFGKFDAFQQRSQKRLKDDYIKILRNPESLRQAIVMSEILKRKF